MIRWNWLPWKFIIRRAARAHGFLDPVAFVARLQRFAQPSEVTEPVELLRAGVVFHARGLINSRVIQHNLDWVWPYWIEQQFDPRSEAFVPRAFSVTHVNLTHRNWTAVGLPDEPELPIVDPRGLVTPLYDGWSLDGWVLTDGEVLHPSRAPSATQRLELDHGTAVVTEVGRDALRLAQRVWVEATEEGSTLRVRYRACAERGARLAVAVRPYNPEGISFIHRLALTDDRRGWRIDGRERVRFDQPVEQHHASDYRRGDVAIHLSDTDQRVTESCDVGLATAAAVFELRPGEDRELTVSVPLPGRRRRAREDWPSVLRGSARLEVPDPRYRFLYDAAVRSLVLHSVEDVYPGPFTYRRFWYRDAAFIVHALLAAGMTGRARRALARFPERQNPATGYFHSQEGEWDSNGQALWILGRYAELTGDPPPDHWLSSIRRGARWIGRKRRSPDSAAPHAGLLPAGFSAEHLGPNDYYYWDDFWGIAGLRAAARLLADVDDLEHADWCAREADDFERAVTAALARDEKRLGRPVLPASPYRRLDAGAVGSIVAGYPLDLLPENDVRLRGTVDFLLRRSTVHGGFFQDMIHSGVNAYLTLHLAQVLLRARDPRCFALIDAVARLASDTGQWPEAIHPRTLGGCMGDGHHVWASAEWVMMMRNCFVREEGDRLVLAAGIPEAWLASGERMSFGPTPTRFGTISVTVGPRDREGETPVRWSADWRRPPSAMEVGPPGAELVVCVPEAEHVRLPGRANA